MKFFYVPHALTVEPGAVVTLAAGESRHATTVLRLKPGDEVLLLNGAGGKYGARIAQPDVHATTCIVTDTRDEQPMPYRLHIAISPTKTGERFEWFVEKAVEMGVTEITPLLCEHTERSRVNVDKLQNLVVSAGKQSGTAWFPVLNKPVSFATFIRQPGRGTRLIAHCAAGSKQYLRDLAVENSEFTVLVGPEGDFSSNEINLATGAGFAMLALGPSRLRTETAGVYVCAALSAIFT